jgi:hypothetical protein
MFSDAEKQLQDKGLDIQFNENISAEAIKGWSDKLNNIFLTSGEEGIGKI